LVWGQAGVGSRLAEDGESRRANPTFGIKK